MAVLLQMTYSKKLGLPNFSSHSCSVSLQVEIADVSQVTSEVKRLYALTQDSVDREIQQVGYLPDATTYGMNGAETNGNGRHANGNINGNANGYPVNGTNGHKAGDSSGITDKQLDLIHKVVRENNVDKQEIEQMAQQMFGTGVRQLNRMQASNFIDELFNQYGRNTSPSNGTRPRYQHRERSRA